MQNGINNINELPSIDKVKKTLQGLALMDAILMSEWEYRFFSYNSNWDGKGDEAMASMRDGEGNEYFLYFSHLGVAGKVLFKNKIQNPLSILEKIPDIFEKFKNEVAFNLDNSTFFFWRSYEDEKWDTSPNNLKLYPLLEFIKNSYEGYQKWAESYYERDIDSKTLKEIFISLSINSKQLSILNSELNLKDLKEDIQEIIGIPSTYHIEVNLKR